MGLSSSLNAGVMGLSVNATKLATISDNIANANTIGYKRQTVEFSSLVVGKGSQVDNGQSHTAGGVRANIKREIDQSGTLQTTNNGMDIGVSGRGYLPITDLNDPTEFTPNSSFAVKSTGSFQPDENNYLRDANGHYLLGRKLNIDGTYENPSVTEEMPSTLGMEVVRLTPSTTISPTTQINFSGNIPLDATQPTADPTADYTVPIIYYDVGGANQTLSLEFMPVVDDTAVNASNQWNLRINDSAHREQTSTVYEDADIGQLNIQFTPGGLIDTISAPNPYNTSNTPNIDGSYLAYTFDTSPTDANGAFTITRTTTPQIPDPGDPGEFIDGTPIEHVYTYNPNTGNLRVQAFGGGYDYAGGDDLRTTIDINIGKINTPGQGVTQYSGDFITLEQTKNGSPLGTAVGYEISDLGIIEVIFDNGLRQSLYEVPLATMINPNAMSAIGGQAYRVTPEAGELSFKQAGSDNVGKTIGYALTSSATDVAQELTSLIETQRAYSSNAKIIQTVDEMLQETTNLKR